MKTTITLTQEAYINDNGTQYTAMAQDAAGNDYRVIWSIFENIDIDTLEDESEACDWDAPVAVIDEDGNDVLDRVTIR